MSRASRVVPRYPCRVDAPQLLPYGRQTIEEDDVAAVAAVLHSDWLTCGPVVEQFEEAFARKVGAAEAVVCSSGTAALHLAGLALDLAPGDAVVVPAITFAATANAQRYCGAEVVFADVDPDTGLMTAGHLAAAVARAGHAGLRPKAVAPVHLNGQVCDMPGLAACAADLGLCMVEDACHALGAQYRVEDGRRLRVGACGHAAMTVFSLHPVKTATMGEGGVVTTNDRLIAKRLRRLRTHGITRDPDAFVSPERAFDADGGLNPWYSELQELGLNYRASDIHCALGLSQLGKLDRFVNARRGLMGCYDDRLAGMAPLVTPVARAPGCSPAWHLAVALIDFAAAGIGRGLLMRRLAAYGIGTQVHYLPLHWQPYYQKRYGTRRLPGAEAYYARCLSLPLFPAMSSDDVDRVVDALVSCLTQGRAS